MALDRRTFLRTSLAAGAGAGLLATRRSTSARAQSTGPNPALYTAFQTTHNVTSGNTMLNHDSGNDYANLSNVLSPMIADWRANNGDQQMAPVYAAASEDWMHSASLDLNQVAAQFAQYNPGITAGMLSQYQTAARSALVDQDYTNVLTQIRTQGIASIFDQINANAQNLAANMGASKSIAHPIAGIEQRCINCSQPVGHCGVVPQKSAALLFLSTSTVSLFNVGIPSWGLAGMAFLEGPVVPAVLGGFAVASLGWSFYNWVTC